MKKQVYVWLEITLLFILPILLFYFKIIPDVYHYPGGLVIALAVIGLASYRGISLETLGFRIDNIKKSLPLYGVIAAASVLFIVMTAKFLGNTMQLGWWTLLHFQGLFFVSSFVQEFMYRGYLLPRLKEVISRPFVVIFLNATLFLLLHIVCPGWEILPISFLFGVAMAAVYYDSPNIYLATIVHAIANFTAALYGVI